MGLFENLKGVLGDVEAAAIPALINSVLAKTNMGGLSGLVAQLQQGGLGPQVQSWLSNGANMHVTPDQLRAALGNAQVQEIARHFNLPVDAALKLLSEQLPQAVDQASPNGTLKS